VIARIRGTLLSRRPDYVVVDVGGVGYGLFVSLNTFYQLPAPGQEVTLEVHTVVREDAIHLYGFAEPQEKEAFAQLIAVTGVGPKVALGVLSGITPRELWQAVKSRDTARLCKVPGVGKKTAARLVVDLEGKLPPAEEEAAAEAEAAPAAASPLVEDAVSALVNLGYPQARAQKVVESALAELGPEPSLEELLRRSLQRLAA